MGKDGKGSPTAARDQVTFGLLLVAGGAFLFLVQRDVLEVRAVWLYWPVVLIVIGLVKLVSPRPGREMASGLLELLAGLWFLACNFKWQGITYRETWPLLLVFFGLSEVLKALSRGRPSAAKEQEDGHA